MAFSACSSCFERSRTRSTVPKPPRPSVFKTSKSSIVIVCPGAPAAIHAYAFEPSLGKEAESPPRARWERSRCTRARDAACDSTPGGSGAAAHTLGASRVRVGEDDRELPREAWREETGDISGEARRLNTFRSVDVADSFGWGAGSWQSRASALGSSRIGLGEDEADSARDESTKMSGERRRSTRDECRLIASSM